MYGNLLGEFLGTLMLVVLGCGVVANVCLKKTKGENSGWIVITVGWGIAVTCGVFLAEATGSRQADINPAVTLAKIFMGVYTLPHALITMAVQFAGAFIGAFIIYLFYHPYFKETPEPEKKLGVFCTAPAIRKTGNALFCEIAGTVVLITVILAIFEELNGNIASQYGPYLIGFLVWGIGVSLGGTTGYAINPARDLGPRIAHAVLPIPGKGGSDWGYAWVPVLGPFIGGAISFGLARIFKLV
ncbi:MAG TPA: MIP/aquaporin family protein [Desulfomonilia bacterium]|jgi:glycerol uptake facilitator protein